MMRGIREMIEALHLLTREDYPAPKKEDYGGPFVILAKYHSCQAADYIPCNCRALASHTFSKGNLGKQQPCCIETDLEVGFNRI